MTYLLVNAAFLLPVLALAGVAFVRARRRRASSTAVAPASLLIGLVGVLVATAIFDNVIIGTGIVDYDSRADQRPPGGRRAHRGLRLRDRGGGAAAQPVDPAAPPGRGETPIRRRDELMRVLRALFASSRPISWVNTAYPFAAAYILTTGRIDAAFVIGTIYFLVPYNLAMYGINDVFDYESDLRNPRKGGVEGAVLSKSLHRATLWGVVITNAPFLVALLILGSPISWLVLAVSVFAVLAYSAPGLRFKERPFVDSLTSSTHFVSPAVYGLALAGATVTVRLVALLVGYFIWGIASHAFGAVQDVVADRAGRHRLRRHRHRREGDGAPRVRRLPRRPGCSCCSRPGQVRSRDPGALLYAANVAPFLGIADADAERANAGWRRFLLLNYVTGFLVTMLLIWWAFIR